MRLKYAFIVLAIIYASVQIFAGMNVAGSAKSLVEKSNQRTEQLERLLNNDRKP